LADAYDPTFIPKRYSEVSRVGEQLLRERMTYVILNGIIELFEKWSVHPDLDLYEARR
jgi:hypothetical protein